MSMLIPLSGKYGKNKFAIIDKNDYVKVINHSWYCNNNGYVCAKIGNKTTLLSRIIMNVSYDMKVDHINMNILDNRKSNLRICNRSENGMNRNKQINNTSGYKGVTWHKRLSKFMGQIVLNSHHYHLGYFDTSESAARAYNDKAKELFGKFARLNNIDGRLE